MVETLKTVLGKLAELPNGFSEFITSYDALLESNLRSKKYRASSISALIRFCKFSDKNDFFSVNKADVQAFLDTKRKSIEEDPEQRWIRTYNDYLAWLKPLL